MIPTGAYFVTMTCWSMPVVKVSTTRCFYVLMHYNEYISKFPTYDQRTKEGKSTSEFKNWLDGILLRKWPKENILLQEQQMISNFKEFLDYVESFYLPSHPDVLYPINNLTREEIALATLNYLDLCEEGTHVTWGNGDSLDRERVRDLIINRRATLPQLPVFT